MFLKIRKSLSSISKKAHCDKDRANKPLQMMIEEILVTYGHIKVKVKQMLCYWKYFHSTKFWTSLSVLKKRVSSKQGVEFCMFAGAWVFQSSISFLQCKFRPYLSVSMRSSLWLVDYNNRRWETIGTHTSVTSVTGMQFTQWIMRRMNSLSVFKISFRWEGILLFSAALRLYN